MLGSTTGINPPFEMDNRSKRSIVLDLTTDGGLATARQLLAGADVFVTNVRPDALGPLEPRLSGGGRTQPADWCTALITGYGETGPDADRPAYDVAAFWARSGVADLLTRPGDSPPFQRGGMGDHMTGMTLAAGDQRRAGRPRAHREGQLVTHVAVPPGHLHGELRPQHVPAERQRPSRSASASRCSTRA